MMASKTNNDVLHYHQAMNAEDADSFREAMEKEFDSFKQEKMFKLLLLRDKLKYKSLIPFTWSFERKRNPLGDFMKYEACSCVHGGEQIKGIDF